MGYCVMPEVACAGRGQLWPSEPFCPVWHLTGVCTASWSHLHVLPVPGTPWMAKQPLLSHGAGSAHTWGHPLLYSQVLTIPPCASSTCPRAPTLQSHRGSGAPCSWQSPCVVTWRAEVTRQGQPAGQSMWGDHRERARPGFGSVRARWEGVFGAAPEDG